MANGEIVHVAMSTSTGAAGLLRRLLAEVTGTDAHVLDRRCGVCGGPHGGLVVRGGGVHVSLSRTSGLVAAAVTVAGPVGVDVETDAATLFDGFDGVALAAGERADGAAARARLWTRKEAVLKAAGVGLTVDPRDLRLTGDGVDWPAVPGPVQLFDVRSPDATTCSAAVLSEQPLRLVLSG